MDRMRVPEKPFNPKRPGALVGVMVTAAETLSTLFGGLAEFRNPGSYSPCVECGEAIALTEIDPDRMIAPELSLKNGAVLLWAGTDCAPVPKIKQLASMLGIDYLRPLEEQDRRFISILLHGYDKEPVTFVHNKRLRTDYYRGCMSDLQSMIDARTTSKGNLRMISFFSKFTECPACRGTGFSKGLSNTLIAGHTLAEAQRLSIAELLSFIKSLRLSLDAHEYDMVSPLVSQLELKINYLSKIGLRALPPVLTRCGHLPLSIV